MSGIQASYILRHRKFKSVISPYAPHHVAVIMDGNRRYAHQQGLEILFGHRRGSKMAEKILGWAYGSGVRHLTIYAFSTENFNRPQSEIDSVFSLLEQKLKEFYDAPRIAENGICIRIIGNSEMLPKTLVQRISEIEQKTKNNTEMYLNIALAYGGWQNIVNAFNKAQKEVSESSDFLSIQNHIKKHLSYDINPPIPDVDLIIRTGGEYRISNFLPWQACGNEAVFYASSQLWPEFTKCEFIRALQRYRHIKKIQEQNLEKRKIYIKNYILKNKM